MSISEDRFIAIIKAALTPDEREHAVAYAAAATTPEGVRLELPGLNLDVPWESYLAFIDRQPMANWSHSARYLLVNSTTGESRSIEAQLPPFRPGSSIHWKAVYKAPALPDAAVAHPQ